LNGPGDGRTLRLRLRGYHPNGRLPEIRVSVNGQHIGTIAPQTSWQIAEFPLPVVTGRIVVRLEMPTFVPGYADQRLLGAMLDWVELTAIAR
jgi:hypothetical protein